MTTAPIDDLLVFWFAPENRERWFTPDPAFDAEIARRFAPLIADAMAGRLAGWVDEPRGALALCLLLDQFPRHVWRGTPRTFAGDAQARDALPGRRWRWAMTGRWRPRNGTFSTFPSSTARASLTRSAASS